MASGVKFHAFAEAVFEGVHNFASHTFIFALSNTAPTAATDNELADITQISYTNLSSRTATISASSQTSGTYTAVCNDLTLTASGGSVATFRYIILYNDTATGDPLVCYWDYGSGITMADTDQVVLDLAATLISFS